MSQSREHLLPATADHRIDSSDPLCKDGLIEWSPIVDHTMVRRQVKLIQYTPFKVHQIIVMVLVLKLLYFFIQYFRLKNNTRPSMTTIKRIPHIIKP